MRPARRPGAPMSKDEGNIMFKRILIPVDGSHTATLGLQLAVKMARQERAKLRVISVRSEEHTSELQSH